MAGVVDRIHARAIDFDRGGVEHERKLLLPGAMPATWADDIIEMSACRSGGSGRIELLDGRGMMSSRGERIS